MNIKQKSDALAYLDKIIGDEMTIGATLRAHREAEDLTQQQLAKKLKISRVHLSQIEKGHKFLSPERAKSFAQTLGYSPKLFVQLSLQEQLDRAKLPYKIKLEAS
jgi:transcriptional regulator with XRE-family HTH domain